MVTYAGTDPADPELCSMAVNGKVGGYLFGRIDRSTPSAADIAAAYRKVLSGPPGTAVEFRFVRNDGTNYMYRYKNEALETFQIGGEARPTVRIAFTESGMGGNHFEGTWRRWFDVQTGAVLRQSYQHVSGQPPSNQDWKATSITVPKS